MLKKPACLLAKIGADTAENEQHFAENVGKIGRRVAATPKRCTCITSACATQSKKPTTRGRPDVTPNSRCDGWMHVAAAIATPRSYVPVAFV